MAKKLLLIFFIFILIVIAGHFCLLLGNKMPWLYFLLWLSFSALNLYLAKKRDRSLLLWALAGFFVPVFSTAILALWPAHTPQHREKISPELVLFLLIIVGGFYSIKAFQDLTRPAREFGPRRASEDPLRIETFSNLNNDPRAESGPGAP